MLVSVSSKFQSCCCCCFFFLLLHLPPFRLCHGGRHCAMFFSLPVPSVQCITFGAMSFSLSTVYHLWCHVLLPQYSVSPLVPCPSPSVQCITFGAMSFSPLCPQYSVSPLVPCPSPPCAHSTVYHLWCHVLLPPVPTVQCITFFVLSGLKFKGGTNITAERNSSVVLEFSIDKSCRMDSVTFTNCANATDLGVYCSFLYVNGTCVNPYRSSSCYCDPVTSDYRIIINFSGLHRETWRLTGQLANSTTFTETININVKCK